MPVVRHRQLRSGSALRRLGLDTTEGQQTQVPTEIIVIPDGFDVANGCDCHLLPDLVDPTLQFKDLIVQGHVVGDMRLLFVRELVDIDVGLGRLIVATLAMAPLMLAFAALALLAGAVLATRRDATMAVAVLAIVSFFVNSIGQASDVLEPLRPASLFYHFHSDRIVISGVDAVGVTVLLATAVVATGLAALMFQRRDIGVVSGGWTKQLRQALSTVGWRREPVGSREDAA